MGVPAFFRWLSRKYAAIVVHCVEEKPKVVDDVKIPVDSSKPNPNDVEFDNLYLDMNGIIHPCCHPEDKPAPKNEDEMMVLIFEYIDRIISIVRPRKLLYMAIDGVAPRAKMNQQRSRRFRASKETHEKVRDIARIKEEILSKGGHLPDEEGGPKEHFDSNCITPGTEFMFRLADCLRYYVHDRLNNDPGWADMKVILSDANAPGEGEHKIMDYIRRQRAQPAHDPNTHHCLCGADADLIMLGLATHEPNFTIIREEFKPNQARPCEICKQVGHEMKECTGVAKEKKGEHDELNTLMSAETEFIFLRLNILREYLERELQMSGLPFEQDMERAIDDWVFMCFFVGNDFLPHLPSLEIREGAIDRLVKLYKKAVYKTGGYLTDKGFVNLERVQLVMTDLGEVEDEIFKARRDTELDFRKRNKERKKRQKRYDGAKRPSFLMSGQYAPTPLGGAVSAVSNPRQEAAAGRVQAMNLSTSPRDAANQDSATALRNMLTQSTEGNANAELKRKKDSDSESEPDDEVQLWEDGWKDRYYQSKFDVGADDKDFRYHVANEYVQGLCWVLQYYYQGCPSWKWYFPYHYAPFASDFLNIGDLNNRFEKNTSPFKPLEQLMGVFPAGSKKFLPPTWQELMYQADSGIIDFYPTDFKIDLNGKKYAWQGVALLPFVDEKRLWAALDKVYGDLTEYEKSRNIRGSDRLFVGPKHPAHDYMEGLYEGGHTDSKVDIPTDQTQGMKGQVWCDEHVCLTKETFHSPLPACPDLVDNRAICCQYLDPQFDEDFEFSAAKLPGAKEPGKVLKPEDFEAMERSQQRGRGRGRGGRGGRGGWRPQLGFQPNSGYRGRGSYDSSTAQRFIRHESGQYSNVGPPRGGGGRGGGGYGGQGYGGNSGGHHGRGGSLMGSYQGNQGGYGGGYGNQGGGGYGNQGGGYGNRSGGYGQQQQGSWQNSRQQGQAYQQNQQRGGHRSGQYDSYSTSQRGRYDSYSSSNRNQRSDKRY